MVAAHVARASVSAAYTRCMVLKGFMARVIIDSTLNYAPAVDWRTRRMRRLVPYAMRADKNGTSDAIRRRLPPPLAGASVGCARTAHRMASRPRHRGRFGLVRCA